MNDPPRPSDDAPWYHGVTRYEWLVLLIASLGWVFDVYEGQIFVAGMEEISAELQGTDRSGESGASPETREADKAFFTNVALAAFSRRRRARGSSLRSA